MKNGIGAFDWNQMRAFLATVETGSLSAGARLLGLTQPTLSRQIASLEASLGLLLFDRVGKRLVLTSGGSQLAEDVRAMGSVAERISLTALGQSQSVSGLVRVTASDIVAAYILPEILTTLAIKAPQVKVEVIASNTIDDLLRREADIAIRHIEPRQPDLIARRCRDHSARLYASDKLIARYGRPSDGKAVAQMPFIGFANDSGFQAELHRRGIPVTEDNFRFFAENGTVIWEMVKQGLGVGAMFTTMSEGVAGIECLLPHEEAISAPVWVVAHRELQTSRRIRLVFDMLAEALM